MTRSLSTRRAVVGAAVLALLAGCQASMPAGLPGSMQLGAYETMPSPAPVAIAATPIAPPPEAVLPTTPAPAAAPVARAGGGGRSRRAQPVAPTGSLTVDLAPVLAALQPAAQRRILATVADVDRLIVTVSQPGLPDRVTEVTRAEMDAGTTSVPFTGLPTGTCTVVITAKAADGSTIGTSSRVAPVADGESTEVSVQVYVVPDEGEYYSWTNSLIFSVDLAAAPAEQAPDGSGPVSGTVVESYPIWTIGSHIFGMPGLYTDGAGHFYTRYMMLGSPQQSYAGVNRYSTTDGTPKESYLLMAALSGAVRSPVTPIVYDPVRAVLLAGTYISQEAVVRDPSDTSIKVVRGAYTSPALTVDAAGDAYYIREGIVQKQTADASTATTIPAHSALVVDTAGQLWVNQADVVGYNANIRNKVYRYAADGTLLATYDLPFPAVRLKSDAEGGVWVADRYGGQLLRIKADGTVGLPIGVPVHDFCLDADKNLWVAGPNGMLKLAPDGSQLGNYPILARSIAYGDGYIFAGVDGTGAVVKVVP